MSNANAASESMTSDSAFPLVYEELRKLAAKRIAHEPQGISLQPTGLVHEAYLRLVGSSPDVHWDSKGHFFGSAAEAMRRILVDKARKRASLKRGGHLKRMDFSEENIEVSENTSQDIIDLDEALTKLQSTDSRKATVVKLKYFCGLTLKETAEALDVSLSTVDSDWAYARAWLKVELSGEHDE